MPDMALNIPQYPYLLTKKPTICYFQVWSLVLSGSAMQPALKRKGLPGSTSVFEEIFLCSKTSKEGSKWLKKSVFGP